MCGRFTLRAAASVIAEHFAVFEMPPFAPRFNIAPSQPVLVVRLRPQNEARLRRELVTLRWGLVPGWAKDPAIGQRLINARAETVARQPAFRAAFRTRRCLVVAAGFYEWERVARKRQVHFYHLHDDGPFAFAGLWEAWEGADHSALETCTILTTDANATVRPVHDRMPVILAPGSYESWLDPATTASDLIAMLHPCPDDALAATAVGSHVNNPRHEGPECIEPPRELF